MVRASSWLAEGIGIGVGVVDGEGEGVPEEEGVPEGEEGPYITCIVSTETNKYLSEVKIS